MTRSGFSNRLLHLTGLLAFGVSQPCYELLRNNTPFLSSHNLDRLDLFALIVLLSVFPVLIVAALLGLSSVWGKKVSTLTYSLLALSTGAAACWTGLNGQTDLSLWIRAGSALAGGMLIAWSLLRWNFAAYLAKVLSLAALAFPVLFLLDSGVVALSSNTDAAEASAGLQRRPPIVLVVLDELSLPSLLTDEQTIDAVHYPNFAKLAARATWFRQAGATADNTTYSLPAILTGRRPTTSGPPTLGQYPQNLFTWLRNDYRMTAAEWVIHLCPEGACEQVRRREMRMERWTSTFSDLRVLLQHLYYPPEYRSSLPALSARWRDFDGREGSPPDGESPEVLNEAEEEFLGLTESINARDASLYYLHSRLPHAPWQYLPSGKAYYGDVEGYPPGLSRDESWSDSQLLTMQGLQRHLLQLQFTDRLLGRLIGRLRAVGIWDDALFILTADHGVSFLPGHSRRYIDSVNFAQLLSVPLFIKAPGQRTGQIDDRAVETIDVLPTIADVLGATAPWTFEGQSLLDSKYVGRPERHVSSPFPFRFETFPAEVPLGKIVRRRLALLGAEEDEFNIFSSGSWSNLLSRPIEELSCGESSDLTAELDKPVVYQDVDLSSKQIPTFISGHVRGLVFDAPRRLALAMNGRIWTVTETFDHHGDIASFGALVPEEALVAGANDIQVFEVLFRRQTASCLALLPGTNNDPQWTLEESGGDILIISKEEERILVEKDGMAGNLDKVLHRGGWTELDGWAADFATTKPVRVVLFVNGQGRYLTSTRYERADVAEFFKRDDLAISGYHLTAPTKALIGNDARLRLIGVSGNRAVELNYGKDTQGLNFERPE